tara:strand:+ start:269 stop:586 length:318 start_codon:yes stop_codon:yes gene_type:complete
MTDTGIEALNSLAKIKKLDGAIEVTVTLPRWNESYRKPIIKINSAKVHGWLVSKGHDIEYSTGDDIRNNLTDALRSGTWTFQVNEQTDKISQVKPKTSSKQKRTK